ncbi:MAG: cofactor assembly of complex C subunit B [Cyanobacteria bacterium]|nr:cofactor assembly of complex C subunit B [Cyanobacteria bacterium CG_2015-16_32_12]NCO77882.1 cofactor assembly of complex C subunit B [Cyanobacteria bacterium CG_2015-22_32_23]NCQ03055.1 cofactor assembly of complex C subunit B [Cyanobacteria bacterium CG_2015-09_32_10]NCQ41980.1 cofactor assembly of complex C subunit B [Cyanobacteria bacterium CG_2015-04_32_10]NCS84008.1 cofactor assembly of complex C subunit B [Cyanobacteria bacterium CG_2015-02_32_10]
MAQKEQNQLIKNLPLIAGIMGGFLLMINRLTTPTVLDSQARSDALGVILCAMLLLLSILLRQIESIPPQSVTLEGEEVIEFASNLSENVKTELAWASHLILNNTVTKSIVVYYQGEILLRRGILSNIKTVNLGTILKRVITTHKSVYLVDLKHYPAKIEFDYLPSNIQGLMCLPLNDQGAVIVATNIPRSYTKKDEYWIQGIVEKIALTLATISVKV